MKFAQDDIDWLDRLARRLAANGDLAKAKAHEHYEHGEHSESAREDARAASAQHYVTVLQRVTRQMREKDAPSRFVPPTLADVYLYLGNYCVQQQLSPMPDEEVSGWYDHFKSNGWKVGGKTVMKDWQAAIRNGYKMWREKQPKSPAPAKASPDPEGWREFMAKKGKPYKAYRASLEYLREEFQAAK